MGIGHDVTACGFNLTTVGLPHNLIGVADCLVVRHGLASAPHAFGNAFRYRPVVRGVRSGHRREEVSPCHGSVPKPLGFAVQAIGRVQTADGLAVIPVLLRHARADFGELIQGFGQLGLVVGGHRCLPCQVVLLTSP